MLKRITDIFISGIVLILTSPLLLLCMLAIKIESKGPAIFIQERAGLNGIPFRMYKLRGMVNNALEIGPPLTQINDSRLTKTGKLFRRLSIDELPQFFNVLLGDMTIVGPRPEVMEIVDGYSEEMENIFKFKPGLTGISQINGRQLLTPEKRIMMEVNYYESATFFSALFIILKTPIVILTNEGNI